MKRMYLPVLLMISLMIFFTALAAPDIPPVPEGFKYVTGTIDEGYVVKDSSGNEFVWVPVTRPLEKIDWQGQRFPSLEIKEEIPSQVSESITKHQGFYVARYEASHKNDAVVRSRTITFSGTVWTNIDWYNTKSVCEKMASDFGYKNVNTHLMYDAEWDAIVQWLEDSGININDSREYGNYFDRNTKNKTLLRNYLWRCGALGVPKTNNIFDLAGNAAEWTMGEYNKDYRITRGGSYASSGAINPVSGREFKPAITSEPSLGFRPALVIED